MSNSDDVIFKIGVIGPSRVGKTSFITAILENSQSLLAGTPLKMKPSGLPTSKRIEMHKNDRQGSINAGEFNPGGLKGTEEKFEYEFILDTGFDELKINFMDYPGAWIDAEKKTEQTHKRWEQECIPWLNDSTILVIPIDSAVVMEAAHSDHKKALPFILTINQVREVVREWAKERVQKAEEPALLILSPLKCESYFNDNGGSKNKSDELYQKCFNEYKGLFEVVAQELKGELNISTIYAPIDTFGCVELVDTKWKEKEFSATYRVRNSEIRPKGAEVVLISICKQIIEAQKQIDEQKHAKANDEANKKRGFIKTIYWVVSGKRSSNKKDIAKFSEKVEKFKNIIGDLSQRSAGDRIKPIPIHD